MGASFIETTLEGTLTVEQVKQKYSEMEENARHDSGNSYSGDWNMCPGIKVRPDKVFANYNEAEDWLSNNCQKWENAIAVRYKASKKEAVKQPTYNGKVATSSMGSLDHELGNKFMLARTDYSRGTKSIVLADQLTEPQKAKAKGLIDAYIAAKSAYNEAANKFGDIRQNFNTLSSEFSDYTGLRMARNKASLALKAMEATKARLIAYNDERAAKFYEEKTVDLGEKWLIGGIAAS